MILYKLAQLRAFILQHYYNIKAMDEMPFNMMFGDFSDNRVIVPIPRKQDYIRKK